MFAEGPDSASMRKALQRRLLGAFVGAQRQYGLLETRLIAREAASLRVPLQRTEYMALIRALDAHVPKLFLVADTCLRRCVEFTRGEQLEALVGRVLTSLLLDYAEYLCAAVAHLRVQAHLDSAVAFDPAAASSTTTTAAAAAASASSAASSSQATGAYDWSLFQGALQMLQVAQMFASRFDAFDRQLKKTLLEVRAALFGALPPELAADSTHITRRYARLWCAFFSCAPSPRALASHLKKPLHALRTH